MFRLKNEKKKILISLFCLNSQLSKLAFVVCKQSHRSASVGVQSDQHHYYMLFIMNFLALQIKIFGCFYPYEKKINSFISICDVFVMV